MQGFARAEEGAKGLPHLHAPCQGEQSESLTSVSYLLVSETAFLMYMGKILAGDTKPFFASWFISADDAQEKNSSKRSPNVKIYLNLGNDNI